MRVFVTRPEHEAGRWVDDLRRRGFDALAFPLIAILPALETAPLTAAWQRLASYRAAMFVSGNAVRHFFLHAPPDARWPAGTRAWATGAGTERALLEAGVDRASIDAPGASAPQFDSETLWLQVSAQVRHDDRLLIVRGGDAQGNAGGRDWLAEQLNAAGAQVDTVVSYRRAAPRLDAQQLASARAARAVWLFSSSEAISHLVELAPDQSWQSASAVATHPRIAQAARSAGFGVVCESRPGLDAVAGVLESIR
jgi:uroporphyrinogen-III synthase